MKPYTLHYIQDFLFEIPCEIYEKRYMRSKEVVEVYTTQTPTQDTIIEVRRNETGYYFDIAYLNYDRTHRHIKRTDNLYDVVKVLSLLGKDVKKQMRVFAIERLLEE